MSKIKVAIIEDDPNISQMYSFKFEKEGFEIAIARNGEEGVKLIEAFRPNIVLLDLKMPKMNGDEALKIIRGTEFGKDLPVVVLTNIGAEEASSSVKELGVAGYAVKAELTPRQVVDLVNKVLAESK